MAYRLFIGSNNRTHQVEVRLAESILNKYFEGYTISRAVGYWKSQKEQSIVVDISGDDVSIKQACGELKQKLKQEAIAVQQVPELEFI